MNICHKPGTTLGSLNKLIYFSNNSRVCISLKEKLSDADEMTCTASSWQAAELDSNGELSDGKPLALS